MFHHITVLKEEAVEALNIKPDGIYVDCTLGGAGHSSLIASKLSSKGLLIAFDQDESAIEHAKEKMHPYLDRVIFIKSNFQNLKEELSHLDIPKKDQTPQVDGILFDLGVSSPQLDEAERGFSYNHDAELDMRMDQSSSLTAFEIVNEWSEQQLIKILFEYGEEKFAKRVAKRIVQTRLDAPIKSTKELAEIVKEAIPAATRRVGPHPAKRSFQAIRIAVNDELGVFDSALHQSIECLAPKGRVSVITFHSLEDRICKHIFSHYMPKCTCPPDFPMCVCDKKATIKLPHRKPIVPSEAELEINPRARSAKLRAAEKL
ncbi:16S rRNA (cytosine(1402)-N(4))-methyltransferase RsmH [Chengkuizengella axinellae]|uniref:Ribosomal RNA small subunit methyltransferase H n=1 Tax=Chengkuizengella axinellae TaxID=3064388 RepID=A0ABT9IV45_9BACL|nr:16S rRNA (cytosine(1402)-N(4))-methyltransferase RsmH [Chengkuizengella sp. 2205SS18-9]MDP5273148.1 16S rRNA (cytosine(1402)-N(4))-methyltransferase RsmH [Chengkuizengella sp. 2205SS18-9]